jgi:DNA-directed RNA polymerase subunit M/transcription elongation factor TFIIS
MDCPECGTRLVKEGQSYGNIVLVCRECGHTVELPEKRKKPKLEKIKKWTR